MTIFYEGHKDKIIEKFMKCMQVLLLGLKFETTTTTSKAL